MLAYQGVATGRLLQWVVSRQAGEDAKATRDHGGRHSIAGGDFHSWDWGDKGKRGPWGPRAVRRAAAALLSWVLEQQRLKGSKGQGWVVMARSTWLGLV